SAKRTVTCLRSPSIAAALARILFARWSGGDALRCGNEATAGGLGGSAAGTSSEPHELQNLWPAGFDAPQVEQSTAISSSAPQFPQNLESAAFSCPHEAHFISVPY